jgi:2-polyprenyl-3-methyl-5-hydroxy-6-metoxy-1,4-benzoquinol methylase
MPDDGASANVRGREFYLRAPGKIDDDQYQYRGLRMHGNSPNLHAKMAEYAQSYLAPGSKILDLGCGTGALCLRLSDSGFSAAGCDGVSESFKLHGQVPFFSVDLNSNFSEVFPDKFDAITATEIIEHVENPRHFLRQCRNLLNDGGKIFITTPNIDSPMARAFYVRTGNFWLFTDRLYHSVGHITPVSKWVLLKAMDEAGFQVLKVESLADWGGFFSWWKLRLIALLFKVISTSHDEPGQIMAVAGQLKS